MLIYQFVHKGEKINEKTTYTYLILSNIYASHGRMHFDKENG